ncbi:MAG: alpha/beta fold hydrolase [Actinomycetota bacterium]|nr:alpha/beta fold hydrolase [Actinomycetota bacterium]
MIRRRTTSALVAATVLVAATATAAVAADTRVPEPAGAAEVEDVTIVNLADGHEIVATVFRPAGADAKDPVPMVMHSHGWGGSRETSATGAVAPYLAAGYGVLSFDQRGFGESTDDQANIMDPAKEGRDVVAVVDYVASLPWVARDSKAHEDADDPVLFAVGGSYGGGYQLAGALLEQATREDGPRFDALAPEITWHDLNDSLGPQGVPRTLWDTLLVLAGANALPPEVIVGYAVGVVTGTMPDGTDLPAGVADQVAALVEPLGIDAATVTQVLNGPDIVEFLADNGPSWWSDQGIQLDIPVIVRQGTTDNLFNLNQGLRNFELVLTEQARKDSTFIGFNGGHALPQLLPLGTQGSGDPCTALAASDFPGLTVDFFSGVDPAGKRRPSRPEPLQRFNIATPDGACLQGDALTSTQVRVDLAVPPTLTTGVGLPVHIPIAQGPLEVAGIPKLEATISSLGAENRLFAGLSVGTTALDARVVQNNVLPIRHSGSARRVPIDVELPGVGVRVAEGETLYLTLTPVSDMFLLTGSRAPGGMTFHDVVVELPAPVDL